MAHVGVYKALVQVHRTLATHRNSRKASQIKAKRLSKQQHIRLVLLDLLSVAVLIHTVEDSAIVVLAVGLDKL